MKSFLKSVSIICPVVAVISLLLRLAYPQAIWLLGLAAFSYLVLTLTQVIEFVTLHPHKYTHFQRISAILGFLVCVAGLAYIGVIYKH